MKRVEAAHRYEVPVERGFVFITNTANWPTFWPGYVRLEEGSRWAASGDTARLVTRLLGRERELTMTIRTFEPNRLVTYTSTQPGGAGARRHSYVAVSACTGDRRKRPPERPLLVAMGTEVSA